jgi:hypothetical protein
MCHNSRCPCNIGKEYVPSTSLEPYLDTKLFSENGYEFYFVVIFTDILTDAIIGVFRMMHDYCCVARFLFATSLSI